MLCTGVLVNSSVPIRWTDCTRDRRFPTESIVVIGLPSASPFLRLNPHLSPVAVGKMCQGSSWRGEGDGRKCLQFSGQRAHYIIGTPIHIHPTALLGSAPNPSFRAHDHPLVQGRDLNLCSVPRTVHLWCVLDMTDICAHLNLFLTQGSYASVQSLGIGFREISFVIRNHLHAQLGHLLYLSC